MRRLILLVLCVILLSIPVSAVSGISSAQSQAVLGVDGDCQITLNITLQMDGAVPGLVFPLPKNAQTITVNGVLVSSQVSGSVRNVDLSDFVYGAGTYSLTLRYVLENAVTGEGKNMQLQLPLLSGFAYPVDAMSFSVTLPANPTEEPLFTSTYYQESVATVMDIKVVENVISGVFLQRLQDHESLTMVLPVTEAMFPEASSRWEMDTVDLLILAFALLALLYWVLTMRCRMPDKDMRTTAPEGITAGEVGCRLSGQGVDFTMMILSWAQMGYLLIQPVENGRVLLHKRMTMGNERSEFENRFFRDLFGSRRVVDGTGQHYAYLCSKARRYVPGRKLYFLRSSGNPLIFRALAAGAGIFGGISLAAGFVADPGWRAALAVLLGILGGVFAWQIQAAGKAIHTRQRILLVIGIAVGALWILLSALAGEAAIGLISVGFQLLVGLAAAYGGRRSESGIQAMSDILDLRRYLKKVSDEQLRRILKDNPNYFYDLIPYAMALGVDRRFGRKVSKMRLPECDYLTTGMDGHMTVREWTQLLRQTVRSLDALQLRLPIDRLLRK